MFYFRYNKIAVFESKDDDDDGSKNVVGILLTIASISNQFDNICSESVDSKMNGAEQTRRINTYRTIKSKWRR